MKCSRGWNVHQVLKTGAPETGIQQGATIMKHTYDSFNNTSAINDNFLSMTKRPTININSSETNTKTRLENGATISILTKHKHRQINNKQNLDGKKINVFIWKYKKWCKESKAAPWQSLETCRHSRRRKLRDLNADQRWSPPGPKWPIVFFGP